MAIYSRSPCIGKIGGQWLAANMARRPRRANHCREEKQTHIAQPPRNSQPKFILLPLSVEPVSLGSGWTRYKRATVDRQPTSTLIFLPGNNLRRYSFSALGQRLKASTLSTIIG